MLDRIHKISEIVGAVALVASLVFVGIQVNQNTSAIRDNALQVNSASFQDITLAMAQNRSLASAWVKSVDVPGSPVSPLFLDPAVQAQMASGEFGQVSAYASANLKSMETNFLMWQAGNLPENVWQAMREGFVFQVMIQPRYVLLLSGPGSDVYTEEFRAFFADILAEAAARRKTLEQQQS